MVFPLRLLHLCSTHAKALTATAWAEGSPLPASSSPSVKRTLFIANNDIDRSLQFVYKYDLYISGFFNEHFHSSGGMHMVMHSDARDPLMDLPTHLEKCTESSSRF